MNIFEIAITIKLNIILRANTTFAVKGIVKTLSKSNYHINTPITLSDGTKIVVCNQWGQENLSNFILHAELLGFEIKSKGNQKYYSSM